MLENYKKLKKELECGKELQKSIDRYLNPGPGYDKKGFGVNKDSRFRGLEVSISVDSWLGIYGDSNCSTALRILDQDLTRTAFIKVLDRNILKLLRETANEIISTASLNIETAKKELEEARIELEKLEADFGKE